MVSTTSEEVCSETENNTNEVAPFSSFRARRLDCIGGGFLIVELSPSSVSLVKRRPAYGFSSIVSAGYLILTPGIAS